jgi:class 3 adenylate cyclase
MDAPRTRYARSGDVSIAYQVQGDGPTDLVLVWGTFSHIELIWEDPFSSHFLNRLASFSRLILFDKRGCGLSDRLTGQPSLEERIDDVRAVMDAVGSERATIFGESEGGPMSMLFAATHPDRVSSLVLYGAFARWVDEDFEGAYSRSEFEALVDRFVDVWGEGEVLRWFAPTYGTLLEGDLLREVGGRFERSAFSPGSFRELMTINADLDARPIAPTIRVPALVMHRTDDNVVDVRQGRWLGANIPGARYVELSGKDHLPQVGDSEAVAATIEEFMTGAQSSAPADRVLATVLFTDIVDSTRRADEVGDSLWRTILDRHDNVVRSVVAANRGRVVKSTGDGALATFDGPARAISSARAIDKAMAPIGLKVRAGLHCGEVELRDQDIGGIAVHIAARVMSLAQPGEVLVSSTVKDLVAGSPIRFADRGTHTLKGVPDEWRVFAVT